MSISYPLALNSVSREKPRLVRGFLYAPPTFSPGSFPRPVEVGVMFVHELHQLSLLIVEIGDCFMVRRTMQRLEAKELTLREAIVLLSALGDTR